MRGKDKGPWVPSDNYKLNDIKSIKKFKIHLEEELIHRSHFMGRKTELEKLDSNF